jgi:hypothetical protein
MQKLVWKNSLGDEIDLTSGNYGITQWEGFSNASLNIQSQQVPFQDGGVYLDSLINQRELSVTLKMQDNGNLEERYRMRRELIHILNPKLGEGYLIYTNDFISKRIKCVAQIPLFETHNSDTRGTPKASLAWTACEPYWEDLEETTVSFDTIQQAVINNEGDIPINLEVRLLTSNVKNPFVKNLTTKQMITYNGTVENEELLIDTKKGEKGIYSLANKYNLLNFSASINGFTYFKNKVVFLGGVSFYTDDFIKYEFIPLSGEAITTDGNKLCILDVDKIHITTDLVNWNTKNAPTVGRYIFYSYQNECFYTGDAHTLYKSTDLTNWIEVLSDENLMIENMYELNGGVFLQITQGLYKLNSDNTLTQVFNTHLKDVIYAKNEYIIISNNKIYKSQTLSNWNEITPDVSSNFISRIAYYNLMDCYLLVTDDGIYQSYNLTNWVKVYVYDEESSDRTIQYIKEFSKVIITDEKVVFTSDLNNWEEYEGTNFQYSIRTLNTVFNKVIACCPNYIIKLTENGWEEMLNESGAGYKKIIPWKNDKVLLYSKYKVYESSDGDNWTLKCEYTDGINKLCADSGAILLQDYNNALHISEDFVNWTSVFIADFIQTFTTNGDYFLAISNNKIYKITNSGEVSLLYSTEEYLNDIIYNFLKHNFVISTYNGLYLTVNGASLTKVNQKGADNLKIFNNCLYGTTVADGLMSAPDYVFWLQGSKPFGQIIDYTILNDKIYFCNGSNLVVKEGYAKENVINNISKDSNMGFNLQLGINRIILGCDEGSARATITYRQKYLGV